MESHYHNQSFLPCFVSKDRSHHVSEPILEELFALVIEELLNELSSPSIDRTALAKELADLLYVCYSAADNWNIPIDKVFDRVHQANMSKLGPDGKPVYREDGKIMKGPNYQPPQLEFIFK